jgi:hypothetical protein
MKQIIKLKVVDKNHKEIFVKIDEWRKGVNSAISMTKFMYPGCIDIKIVDIDRINEDIEDIYDDYMIKQSDFF